MDTNHAATKRPLPVFYYRLAWRDESGLTWAEIGKRMGVTGSRVSAIMSSGLCPQAYIDILQTEFKMPADLLPLPSREKSGPLSRAEREAVAQM